MDTDRSIDNRTDPTSEDPIYALALATASDVGGNYLSSLVRSLHDVMPVTLAFVARSSGDPADQVSSTSSWRDGATNFPVEYELEGTPCKLLYDGNTLVIPADLKKQFPDKERYESYCGVPLRLRDGRIGGHFAVFSSEVVSNPQKVEGIVRIFGMRAAAELQRLQDDAEREAILARLHDQRAALHKANNFKSSAIGMVAHDLRNPLSTIITRTELVEALLTKHAATTEGLAAQAEKIAKSLAMVYKSTERMDAMITNLLDAARIELDAIEVKTQPMRLSVPITAALSIVRSEARAKQIEIALDAGTDGTIQADEARLIEVMVNLLTNAIKYSPTGTQVRVSYDMSGIAGAAISVKDTGLGMTQPDIDRAFQPFQILSAKPTAGEGSTGLGLVIVKSVVEAHGGTVTIHSAGSGAGTEFRIALPA